MLRPCRNPVCGGGYWLPALYSPYVSTVMVHLFSRSMVHMLLLCRDVASGGARGASS